MASGRAPSDARLVSASSRPKVNAAASATGQRRPALQRGQRRPDAAAQHPPQADRGQRPPDDHSGQHALHAPSPTAGLPRGGPRSGSGPAIRPGRRSGPAAPIDSGPAATASASRRPASTASGNTTKKAPTNSAVLTFWFCWLTSSRTARGRSGWGVRAAARRPWPPPAWPPPAWRSTPAWARSPPRTRVGPAPRERRARERRCRPCSLPGSGRPRVNVDVGGLDARIPAVRRQSVSGGELGGRSAPPAVSTGVTRNTRAPWAARDGPADRGRQRHDRVEDRDGWSRSCGECARTTGSGRPGRRRQIRSAVPG